MIDNYIAALVLLLCVIICIAVIVYKRKKNNQDISLDTFLSMYQQNLINVLQDVVELLMVNIDSFETKEEYERAIISTTITKLEENCEEFGINPVFFKLINKDMLSDILYSLLYTNKLNIFLNSLSKETAEAAPALFDKEVVAAVENNANENAEVINAPESNDDEIATEESVKDCDDNMAEVPAESVVEETTEVNEESVTEKTAHDRNDIAIEKVYEVHEDVVTENTTEGYNDAVVEEVPEVHEDAVVEEAATHEEAVVDDHIDTVVEEVPEVHEESVTEDTTNTDVLTTPEADNHNV